MTIPFPFRGSLTCAAAGLIVLLTLCPATAFDTPPSRITRVWANNGEDKVTREELRATQDAGSVHNSVWNGKQITQFGARNEVVSFNVILEAASGNAENVDVELTTLKGPGESQIGTRRAEANNDLFNFVGRNVELFFVRYLSIPGLSVLAYDHYDERHVPERMRRPHDANGIAQGEWKDRPNHDQQYPDIAVPLELHAPFDIPKGTNQSIWVDIYIPRGSSPGWYEGAVAVRENGEVTLEIPVRLQVFDFMLPDLPSARTMMYIGKEHVNRRYLGDPYPRDSLTGPLAAQSQVLVDRHFQLAHRHKISLIDDYMPVERMEIDWDKRLTGELFTAEHGYEGIGEGVGNNVYSIGTYSSWPWKDGSKADMWQHSDRWVRWFEDKKLETPTDYFLYLIDESSDYASIEKWSSWVDANPGPGRLLHTLATAPAPHALEHAPSLDIPTSTFTVGDTDSWRQAASTYRNDPRRRLFMYNGFRPASGTMVTEDDGIALREVAWGQYKMQVERWFVWDSTYYRNDSAALGETNVLRQAHTFGARGKRDAARGETGWNYNNGDGVLFYPGTDRSFPDDSYNVLGPLASLRLKHWRRGLQDVDYLTLAARVDAARVDRIVQRIVPKILWECGIDDPADPTWVRTDISWPTNPDTWETARLELAEIITGAAKRQDR